jgi:hypothetical protein
MRAHARAFVLASKYEAEHAITLAEFGKSRENEKLMREALDCAERLKREEVC